jgi:hypothetical protein
MITTRQIERLWTAKSFKKLFSELMGARPESAFHFDRELAKPTAVAALAMIRLDELSQSYLPLYSQFLRTVLAAQEADGGWGDLACTALCIRALLCSNGDGVAIQRGLAYLANLQKPQGIWPAVPIRRMAEDAAVSLFILHQLADQPRFSSAVRFADAVAWFESHQQTLEPELREFWESTSLRCGGYSRAASQLFAATAH